MPKVPGKSKHVHASGMSEVERVMWEENRKPPTGIDGYSRSLQLKSVSDPLPSQVYAFQRGLAQVALQLPPHEQAPALIEVLAALGILTRVMPRKEE